jgi:hypothetical protein
MAGFITARTTDDASVIPATSLAIVANTKKFALRVLDDHGGHHLVAGGFARLVSRRIIAQVSEVLKSNTCVQIDCDDVMLLGEILGCWREGPATFVAVELLHSITGLEELRSWEEIWNPQLAACGRHSSTANSEAIHLSALLEIQ